MPHPLVAAAIRRWPLTLLALLLPLHVVALFGRDLWRPDEPREAAIAVAMARSGGDWVVPTLAGEPFCEKPPLTYWAAAGTARLVGSEDAAVLRLPNLLWLWLGIGAVAWAARAWAGPAAALMAGLCYGGCGLGLYVGTWLATDAALMGCSALALLGVTIAWRAPPGRGAWAGYALLSCALGLGFLSKNIVAWLAPGAVLALLPWWEGRRAAWRRWELWVPLLIPAALVLPWVWLVAVRPDGAERLHTFFYENLLGRFLPLADSRYAGGHAGLPWKYLIELPAFLVPMTLLFVAACVHAARACRADGPQRAAWRLAVLWVVPVFVLLSVSANKRGLYLAPLLPGLALAVGLWAAAALRAPTAFDRWAIGWTVGGLHLLAFVAAPSVLIAAWCLEVQLPIAVIGVACSLWLASLLLIALAWYGRQWALVAPLHYVLALLAAGVPVVAHLDRALDLRPVATLAATAERTGGLILYQPDETVIAVLDQHARLSGLPQALDLAAARAALASRPAAAVLVEETPGKAEQERRRAELERALGLVVAARTPWLRGGRSYVTLVRPGADAADAFRP